MQRGSKIARNEEGHQETWKSSELAGKTIFTYVNLLLEQSFTNFFKRFSMCLVGREEESLVKKLLTIVLVVVAFAVSTISSATACHYTPGKWKNIDVWPTSQLTIGCMTYDEPQLRAILDMSIKGDATVQLAHHLIAAKLNVASDAWYPAGLIADADAFLCSNPLGSKPTGSTKQQAVELIDLLDYWNNDPKGWNPED